VKLTRLFASRIRRLFHPRDRRIDVRRFQDLILAGQDAEDGRFASFVVGNETAHVEGVADDESFESELTAQQVLDHDLRERRRNAAVLRRLVLGSGVRILAQRFGSGANCSRSRIDGRNGEMADHH
jgi:hypothetical protein